MTIPLADGIDRLGELAVREPLEVGPHLVDEAGPDLVRHDLVVEDPRLRLGDGGEQVAHVVVVGSRQQVEAKVRGADRVRLLDDEVAAVVEAAGGAGEREAKAARDGHDGGKHQRFGCRERVVDHRQRRREHANRNRLRRHDQRQRGQRHDHR